ncbi:MAG: MBL fold metallo-hydrolase [Phycisphaerae bacterium]|nr:MBL fold metallo-hydrolase [Phycisphaerae bacterium]
MTTFPSPPCPCLGLRVTVLVENTSRRPDTVGEHGFAAYVETERGVVLFDTGATGEALATNARALGVDLARVTAIVLSHGHYDHTGGLGTALAAAPKAKVYFHWRCTAERWAQRFGFRKAIGMPPQSRLALDAARREPVAGPLLVPEGLLLSGPVPGPTSPAQAGFLTATDAGPRADDFADETFLLARAPSGWVVLTGCCHRGLANTLAYARVLAGGEPLGAAIGGFHLKRLSRRDLDDAVEAIRKAGLREVLAGHCTGAKAIRHLAARCGARVEMLEVGLERAW